MTNKINKTFICPLCKKSVPPKNLIQMENGLVHDVCISIFRMCIGLECGKMSEMILDLIESRIHNLNKHLAHEVKSIKKNPLKENRNANELKHTIYELVFIMNQIKALMNENPITVSQEKNQA